MLNIKDKVLSNESYVNAYRIYSSIFSERDCILLSPLKQWTIRNFDSFVENTFDEAELTGRSYYKPKPVASFMLYKTAF